MRYSVYGNHPTHITLSAVAQKYLSATDPLELREFCHEDEDGNKIYSYDLVGADERSAMNAAEVNAILEELYLDLVEAEIKYNEVCQCIPEDTEPEDLKAAYDLLKEREEALKAVQERRS